MSLFSLKSGKVRALMEFLGALLLLSTALMLALASKNAVNRGDGTLAISFSLMALFLALLITVTLVPRLARRIDVNRWKIPFTFSITGLGGFYILGVFLISLAAINTGNNLLFMVLAALLSAVIVSGVTARAALRSISVSLQVPENVFEGESVGIKVSLQNQKRIFPAFSISVEDLALGKRRTMAARLGRLRVWGKRGKSTAGGADRSVLRHPAYFPMIQPGESRSELVSQTFEKRGLYNLEGFRISTRFPFGLFRRGERVNAYGEVLVYPSVREVSSHFHLLPFLPGVLESLRVGQGESLYSIRHYQDGESARWVDWKATAKTGELMSREFTQEEESKFCLILDSCIPPPPRLDHSDVFEKAVSLAASLAAHFCYRGAELEFISAEEYIPRGMGPDQLYRILRSLATVEHRLTSAGKSDLRQELEGVTEAKVLEQLLSAKTFKIIISSKARGKLSRADLAIVARDLFQRTMSFDTYFKLSSYVLIASGFLAVIAARSVEFTSMVLFALLFVISWFAPTDKLRQKLPQWLLNLMALAYFPVYILDLTILSQSFLTSTIHLIFYIAALKLLTRSRDRDFAYLYLISFALLLAASTLTVDIAYAGCLVLFLFSAVSSAILFEMRRSNETAQKQGKLKPFVPASVSSPGGLELSSPFPSGRFALITLSMMMGIVVIAVPLFLLLPRVSLGIYNRPTAGSRLMSGFSETVELGEIGTIMLSDALVMTVRLSESPERLPAGLKWRGVALDYYDGHSWSRRRAGRRRLSPQGEYFKLAEYAQGTNILTQTILLEAMSTDVVFAGHKALAISGDVGFLMRDTSDNLYTSRRPFNKIRYTAVSDVTRPDPSLVPGQAGPLPPKIAETFLQLPPMDERILGLTQTLTGPLEDQFERARAIEAHLKSSYGYSLRLSGRPDSKDPLAAFLFDVREGHCEYFASAMTLMLRQAGIPARLVNGFAAGTYNNLAKAWTVRQRNAHSWVEAYFEPYGWVEFDPTPEAPPEIGSAMTRFVSDFLDAVNIWWAEDIVNYDFWKQYRLIAAVRMKARDAGLRLRALLAGIYENTRGRWEEAAPQRWILIPLLGVLPALVVVVRLLRRGRLLRLSRLLRRMRSSLLPNDPGSEITGFYSEATVMLERHGLIRKRGETPMEFARSLMDHPVGQPLSTLTHIHHRMRFGGIGGSRELSQARLLIDSIKNSL